MAHEFSEEQQEVLQELAPFKDEAAELEKQFQDHRARLRQAALRAHSHYGIPVLRIANIVGVDRRTISVWIEVARAYEKNR